MCRHDEAVTLAFLAVGYTTTLCRSAIPSPSATLEMGEVELIDGPMLAFAKIIEEVWRRHFLEEGFDGVWYHEVVEPMGMWVAEFIARYHRLPNRDEIIETALSYANQAQAA